MSFFIKKKRKKPYIKFHLLLQLQLFNVLLVNLYFPKK